MPRISLVPDRLPVQNSMLSQTLYGLGRVGPFTFDDEPDVYSDFVITFGSIPWTTSTWWGRIPKSRKIAVLPENPLIFFPSAEYLEQHHLVVTPARLDYFDNLQTNWLFTHAGVGWFYGKNYMKNTGLSHEINYSVRQDLCLDFHLERKWPKKRKLLSMIASGKSGLDGHQFRLRLASLLEERLGDEFNLFGFGVNPISNKSEALDDYAYTVVVENTFLNNYVTEKICDAYLGFAQPIYFGAPNIQEFFSEKIITGPIKSPEDAADFIIQVIQERPIEREILLNRYDVMFKLNFFYHLAAIIERLMR